MGKPVLSFAAAQTEWKREIARHCSCNLAEEALIAAKSTVAMQQSLYQQ